ncbi:MAG: insulinase family protein, partial [Burkholderiaceae bacterium]
MKPYFLLIRSILRNISVLLCVLSMGPPVYSQNQTSVESHTLPNGLTLLIKPDRRAPTAVHM